MDYSELRNLLVSERNTNHVQPVRPSFYEDLDTYEKMEEDFYHMRSKRICAEEVRQIRFQKIITTAMSNILQGNKEMPLNMTPNEMDFYIECVNTFKGWKNI